MKKIALATSDEFADLTPEDKLLASCLRDVGYDASPLVWNEPSQNLTKFSAVVIRSCWDYHKNASAFLGWIDNLEKASVHVLNSPSILRWNLEKTYLLDLAERGAAIPPTLWFEKGEVGSLADTLAETGWGKAVLKPTISATAWRTFVVTRENAREMQAEHDDLLRAGGVMIQKFIEEVQTRGEWSFVFFDKKFSHAVLKRARDGDFRVQNNFGGSVESNLEAPSGLIDQARRIIESIDQELLYARVDGVEMEGELCLMELELIEPVLFLDSDRSAAQAFAAAIDRSLGSNRIRVTA